ncbi:MAG TPA: hypothetical protein VK430_10855 [Xanthobacteraceae bacterium]|nr:hypothetical protein [Xanthobacteraceae bacterium]
MPITPFLAGQAFDPEVVRAMSVAFEDVCKSLGLLVGPDPASEAVAKKIIALAQRGVRGPTALAERALAELERDE